MKWPTRTITALGALTLVAAAAFQFAAPAAAHEPGAGEKKIFQSNAVQTVEACDPANPLEWHWVITIKGDGKFDATQPKPAHIHVKWVGETNLEQVNLDPARGGDATAHYSTTSHPQTALVDFANTYVDIYSDWSGNFNLSHRPCAPPPCPNGLTFTATIDSAGHSALSYSNMKSGTWKFWVSFSTNASTSFANPFALSLAPVGTPNGTENDSPVDTLGDLVFTGTSDPFPGPSASVFWKYTIKQGTAVIFDSYDSLDGSGNPLHQYFPVNNIAIPINKDTNCTNSGSAGSAQSGFLANKFRDNVGDGNGNFGEGLQGFTIRATPSLGTTVFTPPYLDFTTDANGEVNAELDGFLNWTVCEVNVPNGWLETFPFDDTTTPGRCYQYRANTPDLLTAAIFANYEVKPLTLTKTAAATYTRTFKWDISKASDKDQVNIASGGTATFNYTVSVTHDSGTDSAFAVGGSITVHNPNTIPVTLSSLTDTLCTPTLPQSLIIAASGDLVAPYSCSYNALPNPSSGTNSATATWTLAGGGSASGTADYAFGDPTTRIHPSITVTDPMGGGTLGTASYTDSSPKTFTYSKVITVPAFNCVDTNNTASFVANDDANYKGSASKTVTVCGPSKTGALTMGFWQNKNGQGIISGGTNTSGVCNSATWLFNYNPFKDLPNNGTTTTASCSQTATYVYNVIKAANASGTSMNAMLKAQMLATALDVYFSQSGNNKINAPAPIGGVKVDLTMICKMIDSTTGTAVCSGSFEDANPSFGTSLGDASGQTVSALLAYAASQSNVGGSSWYGNVKSSTNTSVPTQQLAKDTFDAINNQVVFAP